MAKKKTTRKKGRATSPEELKNWPFRKLTGEIRKQIRRDVGGTGMLTHYANQAKVAGIPNQFASIVSKLMAGAADDACSGSRDRVESKLVEADRRFDVMNGENP